MSTATICNVFGRNMESSFATSSAFILDGFPGIEIAILIKNAQRRHHKQLCIRIRIHIYICVYKYNTYVGACPLSDLRCPPRGRYEVADAWFR